MKPQRRGRRRGCCVAEPYCDDASRCASQHASGGEAWSSVTATATLKAELPAKERPSALPKLASVAAAGRAPGRGEGSYRSRQLFVESVEPAVAQTPGLGLAALAARRGAAGTVRPVRGEGRHASQPRS